MYKENLPEQSHRSFSFSNIAWNIWCVASIVGIWPRYIEPRLLSTSRLTLQIPKLPAALQGLKILQFSDLHLQPKVSDRFLNKLIRKATALSPDIIVFTGDFVCGSRLDNPDRLRRFLCSLNAPYGNYAILGNHDYQEYVSVNPKGDYDVIDSDATHLKKGWKRLFSTQKVNGVVTQRAQRVSKMSKLTALLKETPFKLLHNETVQVPVRNSTLNICGLGEHMLGRCQPESAFIDYDRRYPGIILTHNPDSVPYLKECPGDIILCGHSHGGQVNIPGLCHKFNVLENRNLMRGLKRIDNKWLYINRGVGGGMRFRWFSTPELLLLTLESPS